MMKIAVKRLASYTKSWIKSSFAYKGWRWSINYLIIIKRCVSLMVKPDITAIKIISSILIHTSLR